MAARRLTEAIPVAPQTSAAEVAAIRAEGLRAITCNRPEQLTEDGAVVS